VIVEHSACGVKCPPSTSAEIGGQIEVLRVWLGILNGKCYGKMALMVTTLTLDKTGRLVLPKPVREELQLRPGDSLELESSEERIVLRPARGNARMRKKQGIWVLHGGAPLSASVVRETIHRVREARERKILGETR
jgi:AbrB family looped-hinge helix DNA binding protein